MRFLNRSLRYDFSDRGSVGDNISNSLNGAHARDWLIKVVQMSINASSEDVRIGTPTGFKSTSIVLANLNILALVIVVPNFVTCVVETHLSGRNLDNNISIVSHSLVYIWQGIHEVICEYLVTDSR